MRYLLIIVILAVLQSCNTNDSGSKSGVIKYEVKIHKEKLNLSKFYNDVKYRMFNLPDSMMVGGISNYFVFEDLQIVVDGSYSKAIYLFDKQNNFIRRYKNVGKGPGQYKSIVNCSIDEQNKRIFIFDRQKIIQLTLPDFKFVKTIKLAGLGAFAGMEYYNNAIYLYSIARNSKIGMLGKIGLDNEEKKILIKDVPELLTKYMVLGMKHFSKYNGKLYFIHAYSTKIYEIDKSDNLTVRYQFTGDELKTDYPNVSAINDFMKLREKLKPYFTSIFTFTINKKLLYVVFPLQDGFYSGYGMQGSATIDLYKNQINDLINDKSSEELSGYYVSNNLDLHIEQIQREKLIKIVEKNGSKTDDKDSFLSSLLEKSPKNIPMLMIYSYK